MDNDLVRRLLRAPTGTTGVDEHGRRRQLDRIEWQVAVRGAQGYVVMFAGDDARRWLPVHCVYPPTARQAHQEARAEIRRQGLPLPERSNPWYPASEDADEDELIPSPIVETPRRSGAPFPQYRTAPVSAFDPPGATIPSAFAEAVRAGEIALDKVGGPATLMKPISRAVYALQALPSANHAADVLLAVAQALRRGSDLGGVVYGPRPSGANTRDLPEREVAYVYPFTEEEVRPREDEPDRSPSPVIWSDNEMG